MIFLVNKVFLGTSTGLESKSSDLETLGKSSDLGTRISAAAASHLSKSEDLDSSHLSKSEDLDSSHLSKSEDLGSSHLSKSEDLGSSHLSKSEDLDSSHVPKDT